MEIKLQRSTTSFRRQGSSGLTWNDKFLSGDLNLMKRNNQGKRAPDIMMRRSGAGSNGGNEYMQRTVEAATAPPTIDPPSPKVFGCGFCGLGKPPKKSTSNKRKP
ncbi:MAPK SUBSTRATES IN THE STOMATAL LINEAGE 3 2 [Hibiscus trionum]|uniref:MAPK SUBSTRATES IN THE STOMATAL LINEAGE 3 2 n=1 Tax=Hibiscus trionum TaxID=183268 RepID=A0A9W7IM94_HIBTR|nr:MAPK SUBSTRATES IN THE STOMATAL LINEAGE 3 2 [Hibiscus trionum]